MKKKIIFVIAIILLNCIILSGCNQQNGQNQENIVKLELVSYNVETLLDLTGEEYKKITGLVKNNGTVFIKFIKIEAKFYDNFNNFVRIKNAYINDLDKKDTKGFQIIYHSLNDYYYKINWNNIEFQVTVEES